MEIVILNSENAILTSGLGICDCPGHFDCGSDCTGDCPFNVGW